MSEMPGPTFGIDELCGLTGVARRTVRFYTQKGLLDPPEGERRGAYYTRRHLEQLLLIRKWQQAGVSLERIGRLLRGDISELPPPTEPGMLAAKVRPASPCPARSATREVSSTPASARRTWPRACRRA